MTSDSHPRFIPLPSGHNFRDLGGYRAADGRSVRWRQLFRSGFMSKITAEDAATLHALGIDTICDFRANAEREERPTLWHGGSETELWARDYEFSAGAIAELLDRPDILASQTRDSMIEIYRELPYEQADSLRELFARIAAGRLPLLFNCSAGKDRTGVASALLLDLLGVPRATIEQDYMLTNEAMDGLIAFMADSPKYQHLLGDSLHRIEPLLRAEPDYLATSFAVIEDQHGSVEAYLSEVIGVGAGERATIRDRLLA